MLPGFCAIVAYPISKRRKENERVEQNRYQGYAGRWSDWPSAGDYVGIAMVAIVYDRVAREKVSGSTTA